MTYIENIDDALRYSIGYNAIHNYYNETVVINNVDLGRPVILRGFDAGGIGQCWVCDGYWMQTNPCMTTTYMHMTGVGTNDMVAMITIDPLPETHFPDFLSARTTSAPIPNPGSFSHSTSLILRPLKGIPTPG